MREKIKGFLASNGMIKGHSASAAASSMSHMEISPQDTSSPHPAASSSTHPPLGSHPSGPPSSASESGSRSSTATAASVPPINTLESRHPHSRGLPYTIQRGGDDRSPYHPHDPISPVTPGSAATLSPGSHDGRGYQHDLPGAHPYHGRTGGLSSQRPILPLAQGRPTGVPRPSLTGSPSGSSTSESSGGNLTNGHGQAYNDNALGMSNMPPMGNRSSART